MNHTEDIDKLDALKGKKCERTLACNSLKFRFGCDIDKRGIDHIWVDEPWELMRDDEIITTSNDYPADENEFRHWSKNLDPLNNTELLDYEVTNTNDLWLEFSGGYKLFVPYTRNELDENDWYEHWYVKTE